LDLELEKAIQNYMKTSVSKIQEDQGINLFFSFNCSKFFPCKT